MQQNKKRVFIVAAALMLSAILGLSYFAVAHAQVSLGVPDNFAGFSSRDIRETISNIVRIVLGFLGVIFVLLIAYAGFLWMTSGGDEKKIQQAKKIIISSVIGLLVTLTSYAIASFIIRALTGATGSGGNGGNNGTTPTHVAVLGVGVLESHYPGRNATNIPRNTNIFVTFKERIVADTFCDTASGRVNVNNVKIWDVNNTVNKDGTGDDTLDNNPEDNVLDWVECSTTDQLTFRLNPGGASTNSTDHLGIATGATLYRVDLLSGIKKDNTNQDSALPRGYSWQFTVSNVLDLTPPTIANVFPENNATVKRNAVVQVNFSEPVDPTTASGIVPPYDHIRLDTDAAAPYVPGSYIAGNQYQTTEFISNDVCGVNSCGENVYCLPTGNVSGLVTDAITDMAGNQLDGDKNGSAGGSYSWLFTTTNDLDLTAPFMTSRTPKGGSRDNSLSAPVASPFNERMSVRSITSDTAYLKDTINFWSGKRDVDTNGDGRADRSEVMVYHDRFEPVTTYHPGVDSRVMDMYQNCYNPSVCDNDGNGVIAAPGDDTDNDGAVEASDCRLPNF